MKIKIGEMQIKNIDYRKLQPLQGNLKDLSKKNYEKLKKSFQEKGLFVPMFVWQEEDVFWLLDGHGRERLFSKEKAVFVDSKGNETFEIPALIIQAKDLKDAKEKILLISSQFQRITQEGFDEFTFDLDASWLEDSINFDAFPYLEKKLEAAGGGQEGEDEVPEVPVDPKTKPGDLYYLGDHRLLCGDSTNPDHVRYLLADAVPNLMVTDPPYGVNYDANWRNEKFLAERPDGSKIKSRSTGKVLNDDKFDWTETWSLFPGNVAYIWHAGKFAAEVYDSLRKADFEIRSQIIWAKPHLIISRGDYHWQHESCWYAVKKGAAGNWKGDRSQTTLWEISSKNKGEDSSTDHSTQKPVECMRRPMINNSEKGDIVYEPFMGSGSSLIAAESCQRISYGMELNPAYCDVIVERWEKFTGKKARLIRG